MKGYPTSLLLVGPVNWHTAQFGSWGWVGMLQTMALGLSQSIEIDERPDQIFKQGSIEVPTAAGGRENKQQIPLIAHSMRGRQACSLYGVRVGVCPGVGQRLLSTIWVLVCARGMLNTLFLLRTPQKWQLSFWVFLYLWGPEFAPAVHAHSHF